MKNYDQAAIAAVFQDESSLKDIIEDAFVKFEEDLDEEMTFSDAMELFLNKFETIASEYAATDALDVDILHYYVRESSQMMASDVQYQIDHVQFKQLDKFVNGLLEKLEEGDYSAAHKQYMFIFQSCLMDEPELTKKDLNSYLISVNRKVGTVDQTENLASILDDLEGIAEKHALKAKLENKLSPRVAVKGKTI